MEAEKFQGGCMKHRGELLSDLGLSCTVLQEVLEDGSPSGAGNLHWASPDNILHHCELTGRSGRHKHQETWSVAGKCLFI